MSNIVSRTDRPTDTVVPRYDSAVTKKVALPPTTGGTKRSQLDMPTRGSPKELENANFFFFEPFPKTIFFLFLSLKVLMWKCVSEFIPQGNNAESRGEVCNEVDDEVSTFEAYKLKGHLVMPT